MRKLSPIGWALRPLKRYAEFSGRSSRAEFWWFLPFLVPVLLATWLGMIVVLGIMVSAGSGNAPTSSPPPNDSDLAIGLGVIFLGLWWVALIIPTIAVQVRRLHDINRSGWWLGSFWLFFPVYFVLIWGSSVSTGEIGPEHDAGLAVATAIFMLAYTIYCIVLLVFFCLPGTKGANRFGDDPYGPNIAEVFA